MTRTDRLKLAKAAREKKLPAVKGGTNPCLNCPPILPKLDLRRRIAVGFGYAALLCNGEEVFRETSEHDYSDCLSVRQAENRAQKKPRANWQIVLDGPMHGETYQRQGKNKWVLVKRNQGFA